MKFHSLKIVSVREVTPSSVAIRFEVPNELASEFEFTPGQYLTLRAEIDGEDVRRSYSICSSQDAGYLEVGIKQVYKGIFSKFAAKLKSGDTLQVMPPEGRFTCQTGGYHRYLMIAAGSGITPCLSIISSVLSAEPDSEISMLYGNQTTADIMFRSELDNLKDRHTDRFQLCYFLSRERHDQELFTGRMNGEKLRQLSEIGMVDIDRYDAIYLCGPSEMIEDVEKALGDLGCDTQKIKREYFSTGQVPPLAPAPTIEGKQLEGVDVTIRLDGSEKSLSVDGATDTVLSAARKQGLDLPFSCAGGMCCTCRCKVVEGEVAMDVNYSLESWELESGFVLACQSRPRSQTVVLDFDAA